MEGRKPKLTAAAKEARRRLAVEKVLAGRSQVDVADFFGVHPTSVAKWMAKYRAAGEAGLAARPVPGRPRFLSAEQEAEVREWLLHRPTEFGFRTDLWSAGRVAQLIRERLGVEFHPNYLREWLSKRGYSPQKPVLTHDYPAVQKKSRLSTPTLC